MSGPITRSRSCPTAPAVSLVLADDISSSQRNAKKKRKTNYVFPPAKRHEAVLPSAAAAAMVANVAAAAAASSSFSSQKSSLSQNASQQINSLSQDAIKLELEIGNFTADSKASIKIKVQSMIKLMEDVSKIFEQLIALKIKQKNGSEQPLIDEDYNAAEKDSKEKIIKVVEFLSSEKGELRSYLINEFLYGISDVKKVSEQAYEKAFECIRDLFKDSPEMTDRWNEYFLFCKDAFNLSHTIFRIEGIKTVLDFLQESGFLKISKEAYNICPNYSALLSELKTFGQGEAVERYLIAQQMDPEAISGSRENSVHVFPVFLSKGKTGKEFNIVFSHSCGVLFQRDGKEQEVAWFKKMVKFILANVPEATIYILKSGRQSDIYSCPIFSILDLYAILQDPAGYMERVKQSAVRPPNHDEEQLNYYYFGDASFPMMETAQSVQKLNSYMSEKEIKGHAKEKLLRFIESIPFIFNGGEKGWQMVTKEQNVRIRHRFRVLAPILIAELLCSTLDL